MIPKSLLSLWTCCRHQDGLGSNLYSRPNPPESWCVKRRASKTTPRKRFACYFSVFETTSRSSTCCFALQSQWEIQALGNPNGSEFFVFSKPPRHFAAAPGGARYSGVVGAVPAGTSGCNPPGRVATSCGSAAGLEAWGRVFLAECRCPRRRERAESCRPWSRWRWGCAPREPRRSCTASWIWISGFGTRS